VIEARVDAAIRQKFGLPTEQHPTVKYADLVMLASERRDLDIDDGSVANASKGYPNGFIHYQSSPSWPVIWHVHESL
jgi:hypothetical protein